MTDTNKTSTLNLAKGTATQPIITAQKTLYDTMLEEAIGYMDLIAAGRESEIPNFADLDELHQTLELMINGQGGEPHLVDRNWNKRKDELWYTWSVEAAEIWRVVEPLLLAIDERCEPARLDVTRMGVARVIVVDIKSINDKGELIGLCRPEVDGGTMGRKKCDTRALLKQRMGVLKARTEAIALENKSVAEA